MRGLIRTCLPREREPRVAVTPRFARQRRRCRYSRRRDARLAHTGQRPDPAAAAERAAADVSPDPDSARRRIELWEEKRRRFLNRDNQQASTELVPPTRNDAVQRAADNLIRKKLSEVVRAEVSADIDFSFVEESQESYNPADQVIRSEQLDVESRQGGQGEGGVPGASANQPPEVAAAPAAAVVEENTAFNASSTRRNYELGRRMAYINRPAGDLKRLSVAVLVANKTNVDAEGN